MARRSGAADPTAPRVGALAAAAPVVLASASPARLALLRGAGVSCAVEPAGIDEDAVKHSLRAEGAGVDAAAVVLAELKAQSVSARHPEALVVGADQILDLDGTWFDKPRDRAEARRHLRLLAGQTHAQVSAAVVARGGVRLWHHVDRARLVMRPLDDSFIDAYLAAIGEDACASVGAYRLEGLGAQLFERVEGDYFTVLGLPLLPLLDFLRAQGVLMP